MFKNAIIPFYAKASIFFVGLSALLAILYISNQSKSMHFFFMKKINVTLIFIVGILLSLHAQTGKLFNTGNELSNSLINTIFQDSRNYIWIATEDGLNKYDGIKFTIYRNEKTILTR
jgi:hypothetical protein